MKRLENKVCLVTGSASGIGKAIALLFAKEGAKIILCDNQEKELKVTHEEIKKNGGISLPVLCDLRREDNIKHLFEKCIENYDRLDILVNNAGIMDDFLPINEISTEKWNEIISVNMTSVFHCCRSAITIMLNEKKGNIINVSSIGGLFGSRAGVAYTASKYATIGITKNIAFQFSKMGIRCNAIAPGGVNTNISKNSKPSAFGYERCISGSSNMPRIGEPEEIANIALFLSMDESSLINGSVITADAGWTAY